MASVLRSCTAQDPAEGWMAYAVGDIGEYERITKMEMTWKIGQEAKHSFAFYSPWFGMDPDDNLNLLQPVNPWSGQSWSMYTEYFQWQPEHNSNSKQVSAEAGQTLHGSITYDASNDSYLVTQTIVETGQISSQTVKCQNGKKFRVPYVVYEKLFPCQDYPPDEVVTFSDILVECDGKDCTDEISWEAKVKDDNCNMAAHIVDSKTITITWDTSASSRLSNYTYQQLYALNYNGWAAQHPEIQKLATLLMEDTQFS